MRRHDEAREVTHNSSIDTISLAKSGTANRSAEKIDGVKNIAGL